VQGSLVMATNTYQRRSLTSLAAVGGLLAGVGCIGNIGGDGDRSAPTPQNEPASQCALDLEVRPGLRLTEAQYVASVRDLLGDPGYEAQLEAEPGLITQRAVRQLQDAAATAVSRRSSWTQEVFPCDTTGPEDLACVETFIEGFASRAFRRPLTEPERSRLRQTYDEARLELEFGDAMDVLLRVVLQSPAFVYLFEDGVPEATGEVRLLTDHEVAARLSYFLLGSTPDDRLIAAADAGELATTEGLQAHAERLLETPSARRSATAFVSEMLQLDGGLLHHPLEEVTKEAALYPEVDATLLAAMRIETEALVEKIMFEGSGQFSELWTSREAYVNGALAELYGLEEGPADADTWEWVTLPDERAGLLTRAAFLTTYATATVTAPIRRGHWIREELLCDELGDPPPNVDDTPLEGGEVIDQNGEPDVLTVREATDLRTMEETGCASCHQLINSLGFAFEGFDGIGRVQAVELVSGEPVDTEVEIAFTDFDGTYDGAVDVSSAIATSEKARACFAKHWFDRALGGEAPETCDDDGGTRAFVESGNMKELLIGMIASDAFRYVNVGQ